MGYDVVAIGTNHNLPVEDPIKTAERISPLFDGPISIGYDEKWEYNPKNNTISQSDEYKWIEIAKINPSREGKTTRFSIENHCARKIYGELAANIDNIKFAADQREWFLTEATEEPFALYECETPHSFELDLRIFKEIVDFGYTFPGRWRNFYNALNNPHIQPNKNNIFEFRKHIYRQLKVCGCDIAYYFADDGPGMYLFDSINLPAKEWVDFLDSGKYVKNGKPLIVEVKNILDHTLELPEDEWVDCYIDDFSDFRGNMLSERLLTKDLDKHMQWYEVNPSSDTSSGYAIREALTSQESPNLGYIMALILSGLS